MNPLIIFGLIQGVVTLAAKFMEGKKTATGIGIVAVGGALPVLSVFGISITPDATIDVVNQILGLFGYSLVRDVQQAAQTLLGSLFTLIGVGLALYGRFAAKSPLITK